MLNGVHNHELESKLSGQLLAGRLKEEMRYLIAMLEEHKYVYFTKTNYKETTLEDIFFAHPESISMLNTFSTILVMDSAQNQLVHNVII